MSGIVGVLLAAGAARRFGSDKLLHPLDDGTPLGLAAGRKLIAAVPDSLAVVRADNHGLAEALAGIGFHIVINPWPEQGLSSSLRQGVAARADATGWLIALADMPWVMPATLDLLARRLAAGASVVAPLHRGRRGHPVGFAAHWASQLQHLTGDQGARELLARRSAEILLEPVDDPGVLADVDLRDELHWRAENA